MEATTRTSAGPRLAGVRRAGTTAAALLMWVTRDLALFKDEWALEVRLPRFAAGFSAPAIGAVQPGTA
ncbi:MAG TPA: hypothetical protein VLA98_13965 [Solirubrobacteraceae bacterium]|nr:hypothetical protein [Solirubrobacteraceae bacterium]